MQIGDKWRLEIPKEVVEIPHQTILNGDEERYARYVRYFHEEMSACLRRMEELKLKRLSSDRNPS